MDRVTNQIISRKIYKAIIEDDWDSVSYIFEEDTERLTAPISSYAEAPLYIAVGTNSSHRFVEKFVEKIMTVGGGVETLRSPFSYDRMYNALHVAAKRANSIDAKLLVRYDPDLTQTVAGDHETTPLELAAWVGDEETIRFLLSVTKDKALIGEAEDTSPFRGIPGGCMLGNIIAAGLYDVALYLVKKYPDLVAQKNDQGVTALGVLAAQENAFPSGSRLRFLQRIIYSRIAAKSLEYPILGSEKTTIEIVDMEEGKSPNFLHKYFNKASDTLKNVHHYSAAYIKHIRDIKVRHVQAEQLLKQLLSVLLNLDDDINLPILGKAIQTAVAQGSHELVEECVRMHPEIIWYHEEVGNNEDEAKSEEQSEVQSEPEEKEPSEGRSQRKEPNKIPSKKGPSGKNELREEIGPSEGRSQRKELNKRPSKKEPRGKNELHKEIGPSEGQSQRKELNKRPSKKGPSGKNELHKEIGPSEGRSQRKEPNKIPSEKGLSEEEVPREEIEPCDGKGPTEARSEEKGPSEEPNRQSIKKGQSDEKGPIVEEETNKEEPSDDEDLSKGTNVEEGSREQKVPIEKKGKSEGSSSEEEEPREDEGPSEGPTDDDATSEEYEPSEGSSHEESASEKNEPSEDEASSEGGSEDKGLSLFRAAIKYRQDKVFNLIYQISAHRANALAVINKENGLHLVGKLAPYHRLISVTGVALQMQRELLWFKEVEKFSEPAQRIQRNNKNKTPRMVFTDEHKQLLIDAQQWTQRTSSSSTVVAALLVTIAFAALFTVPGGNNDAGKSIFLTDPVFILFVIADAIALFSSSTSVLMFLSTLTHSSQEDFLYALPLRLTFGLISLFISLATTMIAFSATLVLVLRDEIRWIVAPVTILGCVPVILFIWLQYPLLHELVGATFGKSIFHRQSNVLLH